MSKRTEQELLDIATWFHQNKGNDMSIDKRLEFMTKTVDMLVWVVAGAVGDIQRLEHRGRSGIILPYEKFPRQLVRSDKHLHVPTGYLKDSA